MRRPTKLKQRIASRRRSMQATMNADYEDYTEKSAAQQKLEELLDKRAFLEVQLPGQCEAADATKKQLYKLNKEIEEASLANQS